ncbi:MAG: hypothetical protein JSV49_10685 [Thermoplasmata archaeon]|nr:MAG: hypothetical protein JSV49_10685 [Thermoplasmata archaeon]
MKTTVDNNEVYRELAAIFHSYVLANWNNPTKRLKQLQSYIQRKKHITLELDQLNHYVNRMKINLKQPKIMAKTKAYLFTKEKRVRKYQFGSDFCPNCKTFKNYDKECFNCGYHEMTY